MIVSDTRLCECHHEPMVQYGGENFWRCRKKRLQSRARYNNSEKGRDTKYRYEQTFSGWVKKQIRDGRRARRLSLERL